MNGPFETRARQNYLIVPCQPTPNGRLHLGHMSGPFLRADMLARSLRRGGHSVKMISGSDSYESHVLWRAALDHEFPEVVAQHYHNLMCADLSALQVELDAWLSPLSAEWDDLYKTVHLRYAAELQSSGTLETRNERILFSPDTGRYLAGCWVTGNCPWCGAGVGGYHCEVCGGHFRPEEIVNPKPRLTEPPFESRTIDTLFVRAADRAVRAYIETSTAPAFFRNIALRYLDRNGATIRYTTPGDWGLHYPRGSENVLYTYTGLFPYGVFCGEIIRQRYQLQQNPFAADSNITTIATFGIDNTIPYFIGTTVAALAHGNYKPFDYLLPNHFLDLEGSKFSTSLGHVIWAKDLVTLTPVTSDLARYYLAACSPEEGGSNLDLGAFISIANAVTKTMDRALSNGCSKLNGEEPGPADCWMIDLLSELVESQEISLSPDSLFISRAIVPIEHWLAIFDHVKSASAAGWWMKGLALLAFPVMPTIARSLWESAGHEGDPSLAEFLERRKMHAPSGFPRKIKIKRSDLRPCLPKEIQ